MVKFITEIIYKDGSSVSINETPERLDKTLDWSEKSEANLKALNKWNNKKGNNDSEVVDFKIMRLHDSFATQIVEKEGEIKEELEKKRGRKVATGRPKNEKPANFAEIVESYKNKSITGDEAASLCGVGRVTFYAWLKEYKDV